jgi:mRNA interferase RelE/StbE
MAYQVIITDAAEHDMRGLQAQVQKRVQRWIDLLAEDPRRPGTRQRVGYSHIRRVHAGKDYVILYTIDHGKVIVMVLRIEHRRDVYRNL